MRLLSRYILNEFLKIFFLILVIMISLFLVIHFFETIDEFIIQHSTVADCVKYFIFKIPWITFWMVPPSVLLSTVIVTSIFSRNNELTAMKACGISLIRMFIPVLATALVLTLFTIIFNEYIIPFTTEKANHILYVKVRKQVPKGIFKRDRIWFHSGDGSIWNIQLFDPDTNTLKGVSIYRYSEGMMIRERIDATLVTWIDGKWHFSDGVIRTFYKDGTFSTDYFKEKDIKLRGTPEDLKEVQKRPEEMSLREIYRYVKKIRREGFDDTRYTVDMHQKLSYPFISLVMTLIGIPLSLRSSRSGGMTFCIGLSIVIGFSFYFIFSMGISLGYNGGLPPLLAAWGANLIFITIGLYLLLTVRQ